MTQVYLLKNKSKVRFYLLQFFALMKIQFDTTIKRFQIDNAKDYFNLTLAYFPKEEIIQKSSCVCTPEQNGVAE